MPDIITIASPDLTVAISTLGAELQSVTDARGDDWLWNGDPALWNGRAPILFPTVGALTNGTAQFGDAAYPMAQHGFARRREFTVVQHGESSATFRIEADDETRTHYPFAFRFDVTHHVVGATLTTTLAATNLDETPMPVGAGFHPALRWPLPRTDADSRFHHMIRFDADEPEPIRGVVAGGLIGPDKPTPIHGNELQLHDSLFAHDALVMDRPNSRGLWYGVPDLPGVRVDFPAMPYLGIWMKPGAGYLCIEPWHSHADDEDFSGQFADKPGVVTLGPGESHDFAMAMTFGVRL